MLAYILYVNVRIICRGEINKGIQPLYTKRDGYLYLCVYTISITERWSPRMTFILEFLRASVDDSSAVIITGESWRETKLQRTAQDVSRLRFSSSWCTFPSIGRCAERTRRSINCTRLKGYYINVYDAHIPTHSYLIVHAVFWKLLSCRTDCTHSWVAGVYADTDARTTKQAWKIFVM